MVGICVGRTAQWIAATVSALAMLTSAAGSAASSTNVGFDGGEDGGFSGNSFFLPVGGNPDGHARLLLRAFGLELRTGAPGEPANPAFLGDYSAIGPVTFSFDVRVDSLTDFIGNPIARSVGIALIDRDVQGPVGPSGVFFEMGLLSSDNQPGWVTLSLVIDDPMQEALPPGWIGFGDEDPITFEPILPDGATFATVLASVDEFQISTFVPGFFYGDADWNVRIDNVAVDVSEVPLPGALALLAPDLGLLLGFARREQEPRARRKG